MSPLPPILPHIAQITAPLLIGVLGNWCLFGVLVVQTYVYSYNFPEDGRRLKLLVYTVFLLETVQTALTGADLYHWFASGYGDLNRLAAPFASAIDVPIMESIVSAMVHFFFAYRVWVLSNKSWRFCSLICLFSTFNAASALTSGIHSQVQTRFATGDRSLQHIGIIWLSATVVSDILITSAMVYYLIKRKGTDSGFHNNVLVKIVRLTVETNLLTTAIGTISLLVLIIFPDKNWYTCPTAILGKLYSNTLLVSLNNRISIRNAVTNTPVAGRSTAISFAVAPSSDSGTDISHLDSVRSSTAHKFQHSGDV